MQSGGGITRSSCGHKSHEAHPCLAGTSASPVVPLRIPKHQHATTTAEPTFLLVVEGVEMRIMRGVGISQMGWDGEEGEGEKQSCDV